MHSKLRNGLIVATSAICLGIGMIGGQVPAAHATPAVPAVQSIGSRHPHHAVPDASEPVDLKVFSNCGQFKGSIDVYIKVAGGNEERYASVGGKLYARCNGGSTLHFWTECSGYGAHDVRNWETTSSETVGYTWGPCSNGKLTAWVELCWQGPGGYACGNSNKVSAVQPRKKISAHRLNAGTH